MKIQLLQDLQESGSTPPPADQAVPATGQPRRKPIVLADETRTPSTVPPQPPALSADDARAPSSIQPPQPPAPPEDGARAPSSIQPPQPPVRSAGDARAPSIQSPEPPARSADGARTLPDLPHRPAVWHGPAAQRVDAGTPGQRLAPRAARRAPDIAARGVGVAIEAWAERAAQAGAADSRPAPALQPGGTPAPERPTMDVAAFFGRHERPGVVRPTGQESAASPPPPAAASGDSALGQQVAPVPGAAPLVGTHDAPAGAAAVPRRPHLNDVPPLGADPDHTTLLRTEVPGIAVGEPAPAPQRNAPPPPAAAVPGIPAQEHAANPPPAFARASVPEARTEPALEKNAAPFPAAAALPVSPWRRLWKRRVVAWSAAGALAAVVGGGAGWLYAGSHTEGVPVAADTAPSAATRGAQAYAAREPAPTVKAPPALPAPEPSPPSAAPVEAVKPPPPAEPVVRPAPPAPAPDVAAAASRSVATVDLDPPRHAAHRTTAARKRAAAKIRRAPVAETPPVVTEPSPRERREETLMQCRAHGYDERQCIRRGCAMTRYGFACRG
ncbi:hypothetical protein NX784_00950 [Massilia pinisoli]|uniref:Meckel syndrome type 1 protein n=1 Tax=Massilia pinisoli TaxID=1772194 RepID=A0ABT1ZJR8_9BURK|nr:hypothetical protein [Massilia pinisoli]MCS0580151.1 hypothetical protein [Massilia pinisoli]